MTSDFDKIKDLISHEKRACDRLELPLKIRYALLADNGEPGSWSAPVLLDNIAGEGLGFSTDAVLSQGDGLLIEIHLPVDAHPLVMRAEVVWIQKNFTDGGSRGAFSYGLKIARMDDEARKKFEQFISDSIIDTYLDDNGTVKDVNA
jgi:Tfp pilus assembly protein PilZ